MDNTPQEITDQIGVGDDAVRAALRQVMDYDSPAARRAFQSLRAACREGDVIVACWQKPQFGSRRNLTVPTAHSLTYVAQGVINNGCSDVQFFAVPRDQAQPSSAKSEELFA